MEEELNYVTVYFKSPSVSIPQKIEEDKTTHVEVKTRESVPNQCLAPAGNKKPDPDSKLVRVVVLCLGILSVLSVAAIIGLWCYVSSITAVINEQNKNLVNLERQNQELSKNKDGLNWTLEYILQFNNFPVADYCPFKTRNPNERECQPCPTNWLVFQSSCYKFLLSESNYWKTWSDSQTYCQNINAKLVVIESQDEQEFISNHTKFYYDEYHGYWIGLGTTALNQGWSWTDGSNLTIGYWTQKQIGSVGSCVIALPQSVYRPNVTCLSNWSKAGCTMKNRWICESKTLIRPD